MTEAQRPGRIGEILDATRETKERLPPLAWVGLVLAVPGAVLLLMALLRPAPSAQHPATEEGLWSLACTLSGGLVLLLCAAVCFWFGVVRPASKGT